MKILIADDHWVVRESLKQVMKKVRQRFQPFEAATFQESTAILVAHPDIDLMLIDLIMPGFEEFEGLKRLRKEFPDVPVVVVSVHEDHDYVLRSINHGVVGYIPKSAGGEQIAHALERVLAGEVSFPRHILERSPASAARHRKPPLPAPAPERVGTLSTREQDVIGLLGRGFSVARIAADLKLSPQTVRVHLGSIMKKLGLKDRSETIHYAVNLVNDKSAGR